MTETNVARSYNAIAREYEAAFAEEFAGLVIERAMLTAFAELVLPNSVVADVGCGTGEAARALSSLGLSVVGIDISTGMLARARLADSNAWLVGGSMVALPIREAVLGGLLAHYSIIHLPDAELPAVFQGFAQVCASGAPILLVFQDGDRVRHFDEAFGQPVDLDFRFRDPETVSALLKAAGFDIRAIVRRAAQVGESGPRAMVLASAP